MSATKDAEITRRNAIAESAVEQFRALLEKHFGEINKAGVDSYAGDDRIEEPVAKATFAVAWSAIAMAPKVAVKCGWSVRFAAESEEELDPLQSKLGLPEDAA